METRSGCLEEDSQNCSPLARTLLPNCALAISSRPTSTASSMMVSRTSIWTAPGAAMIGELAVSVFAAEEMWQTHQPLTSSACSRQWRNVIFPETSSKKEDLTGVNCLICILARRDPRFKLMQRETDMHAPPLYHPKEHHHLSVVEL